MRVPGQQGFDVLQFKFGLFGEQVVFENLVDK
jgi:hypothetical protein